MMPPITASCCILALILSQFSDRRPGKYRLPFRFAMIPSKASFSRRTEELYSPAFYGVAEPNGALFRQELL
jgi:hypothetical protein